MKTLWQDGYFTTPDNLRLFYRLHGPETARHLLIILHGFGEHAGRYEKFSNYFPDIQIAICDMRGMGLSEGDRAHITNFDQYESDALEFIAFISRQCQNKTPILLGHSLGGLLLMQLHLRHQVQAARFIFSAPCFRVAIPQFAFTFNKIVSRFNPRFTYHNPVYYRNLTHDCEEMKSYQSDGLILRKMTAGLLSEMIRAGGEIEQKKHLDFDVPVHFLLAGKDKLIRTDVAKDVFEKISSPYKTIKIYDNFFHEIFNESEQKLPFTDLSKFIC